MNKVFLFLGVAAVFLAALVQNTEAAVFYGVKINLVLILVIVLGLFTKNFREYLIFVLTGVAMIKPAPGIDFMSGVFFVLLIGSFYLKNLLSGKPMANAVLLIFSSTILFYLITAPRFLTAATASFLLELIYNAIGGLILYLILEKIIGQPE